MSLTTTARVSVNANLLGVNDLGSPSFPLKYSMAIAMATGVASGKADKIFTDRRTLALSGTEDLDLAGVLVDPLGGVLTFAKVKLILVAADEGNTNVVQVKPHATAGFLGPFADVSDIISVSPGGIFLVAAPAAGWPVTATTADKITITNGAAGTPVTYDIIIVGTSS